MDHQQELFEILEHEEQSQEEQWQRQEEQRQEEQRHEEHRHEEQRQEEQRQRQEEQRQEGQRQEEKEEQEMQMEVEDSTNLVKWLDRELSKQAVERVCLAKRSAPLPKDLTSPLPRVTSPFPTARGDSIELLEDQREVEVMAIIAEEDVEERIEMNDDDDDEDYLPERESSAASSTNSISLVGYLSVVFFFKKIYIYQKYPGRHRNLSPVQRCRQQA